MDLVIRGGSVVDGSGAAPRTADVAIEVGARDRRPVQDGTGDVATVTSGAVTFEHGARTGALPGGLLRGTRRSPG